MHKDPRRLKSCNFTCDAKNSVFVIGAEAMKKKHHDEIEKNIKGYKKELVEVLREYAGKDFTPRLPGIYSIASGIGRNGAEFKKEMRLLYFRMTAQAHAWKQHYINAIRSTANPRMIIFMTKELQLWQHRWERSLELTICCMSSVTIQQYAPAQSVPLTGLKRRAPSDVEDD